MERNNLQPMNVRTIFSLAAILRPRASARAIAFGVILPACLALLSCKQASSTAENKDTVPEALQGTWKVTDLYAHELKFDELFPQAAPVITFDAEKALISGMSGCNTFMGRVHIDGQAFSLPGDLALTNRRCAVGMEGEAAFLDALRKANHWTQYNPDQVHLLINDMTVIWLRRATGTVIYSQ